MTKGIPLTDEELREVEEAIDNMEKLEDENVNS